MNRAPLEASGSAHDGVTPLDNEHSFVQGDVWRYLGHQLMQPVVIENTSTF